MAELGEIERPHLEDFIGKRKLYFVPNFYHINDASDEYIGLLSKYWDEVSQQIERLEVLGKVKKIFCEGIFTTGEDALNTISKVNKGAFLIIKKKVEEGAVLFPTESGEIFGPFLDWANCLNVVRTEEVFTKVFGFYTELLNKRLEHAKNIIQGNLSQGEAGLLIMKDEDRVNLQFSTDIEVFLVRPPSYDDILRWLRKKIWV